MTYLYFFTSQRYRKYAAKLTWKPPKNPPPTPTSKNQPAALSMTTLSRHPAWLIRSRCEEIWGTHSTTIKWVRFCLHPTNQPVCSSTTTQRCCKNALRLGPLWLWILETLPMMKRVREVKTASWNTTIHGWYLSSLISSSLVQASQLSCRVCLPIFLK